MTPENDSLKVSLINFDHNGLFYNNLNVVQIVYHRLLENSEVVEQKIHTRHNLSTFICTE